MKFLKKREEGMLFSQPKNRKVIQMSPPGFTWLPAEGAINYQIVIKKANGEKIYEKEVGNDPVHLPDKIFKSGKYSWDVIAIGNNKDEISRGQQYFSIDKNAMTKNYLLHILQVGTAEERQEALLFIKTKFILSKRAITIQK